MPPKDRPQRNRASVLTLGAQLPFPRDGQRLCDVSVAPQAGRPLRPARDEAAATQLRIDFACQRAALCYRLHQSEAAFEEAHALYMGQRGAVPAEVIGYGKSWAEEAVLGDAYETYALNAPQTIEHLTSPAAFSWPQREGFFHLGCWTALEGNILRARDIVRHYLDDTQPARHENDWLGLALMLSASNDKANIKAAPFRFRERLMNTTRSALQVDAIEAGRAPVHPMVMKVGSAVHKRHSLFPKPYGVLAAVL